jgi:hypothetical protein
MADNVEADPGSGGATFASDDIGGVQYPRTKVVWGADGAANDTSAAAPLPVVQTGTHTVTATQATAANLNVTEASAAAIAASLATLDKIVAGNEAQVDVLTLPALPAGNNNIGDVDVATIAAGDNNIGNVDVVTLPALPTGDNTVGRVKITDGTDVLDVLDLTNSNPAAVAIVDANGDQITSFGGGTQYTEGDTDASITGTAMLWEDGSDTLRAVSVGKPLPVSDAGGALTVDNGGTFAVQVDGNALTALQLIDDPVATLGTTTYTETTTKGMIVGAVRRDADTTLVDTTNEVGPLQMDAAGRLKVEVFDGGESHTVDNAGTFAVQVDGSSLTALQLIDDIVYTDDTSTHATGTTKGALIMAAAVPTDSAITANDIGAVAMTLDRKLHVAVMDALPAGTATIGKLAANSGVDIGDVDVTSIVMPTGASAAQVQGTVAHDSGIGQNPVRIGATAESSPKGITLVTDGDVTNLYADLDGILITKNATAWGDLISERVSNTDGASSAFSTFDNAANTRNYITSVTVHNAHASTNGYVDLRDGTAGSILWTFPLPATGGATHNFNPPLRQPTAATALAYDVSAAITTVYISINGFKSKS